MRKCFSFGALVIVFSFLAVTKINAQLPEAPSEYPAWRIEALERIEVQRVQGNAESLKGLARWVFITRIPTLGTRPTDQEEIIRPVREAACKALISIPGHARYFKDSIELHLKSEAADVAGEGRVAELDFSHRAYLFEIMAHLQSPQIVALLGELLDDDRNPMGDSRTDAGRGFANWWHSVGALTRLGIEGVPAISLKGMRNREAAREQWKLWFAQVKAGNRTFRFNGDPQEYNLQGPVRALVSLPSSSNVTAPESAQTVVSEEIPARRWPLWVALGVLAGGVAVYVGKRRAA